MRRLLMGLLFLFLPLSCMAQGDWPAIEVYAAPSYMWLEGEEAVGFHASAVGNLSKHWSFVIGDFSGHWGDTDRQVFGRTEFTPGEDTESTKQGQGHGTCNPNAASPAHPGCSGEDDFFDTRREAVTGLASSIRLMSGIKYRHSFGTRVVGHGQALVGWSRVDFNGVVSNGVGFGFGGGADWLLNDRFSIRIVQVDWLPTRIGDQWQQGVRVGVGIVINLRPWFGGFRVD